MHHGIPKLFCPLMGSGGPATAAATTSELAQVIPVPEDLNLLQHDWSWSQYQDPNKIKV